MMPGTADHMFLLDADVSIQWEELEATSEA